jgi:hypothetical protein
MMYLYQRWIFILSLSIVSIVAFAPCRIVTEYYQSTRISKIGYARLQSELSLSPSVVGSMIVATIDSDIANIPTNEFAPVFAGGVAVMFGGLLSALIVGFIIDKRNLYANLVADSYAQGEDDEDFWKGLNEEEKRKTQELLQRVRESKLRGSNQSEEQTVPSTSTLSVETQAKSAEITRSTIETAPSAEMSEIEMFSDYGKD